MGIAGACRKHELVQLKISDIEDLTTAAIIKIDNTKNNISRKFTISGLFYNIYKKYANLRPCTTQTRFFLNYQHGKCTQQVVGINKIGSVAKTVATFLQLDNPELYTGHCFRRSSATILVDAGGDLPALKRHGGWKSSQVAEGYIDDSITNRDNISHRIMNAVASSSSLDNSPPSTITGEPDLQSVPITKTTTTNIQNIDENIENHLSSSFTQTPFNFTNCQGNHFTFNFYAAPEKRS